MKVTNEEQEYLKNLLWSNVKYQETYNELYDHVLTAVEELPDNEIQRTETFNNIIENHFGGMYALEGLETERAKIVSSTIRKKQRQYLLSYFKLPLLLFTVLLAGSMYYAADMVPRKAVLIVVLFVGLSPAVIAALRGMIRFFKRKHQKPSIKDKVIEQLGTLSMSLFNMFVFLPPMFMNDDNYKFFKQAHASIITVTALFFFIYSLSFIRLYRDEFKMQLAA